MNRHQVLTGACNPGDQCYAVGSVEGIHFTAYAAGCNIVILAGNFERVQIIPGVTHGNTKVTCLDCSLDSGKIAASYGKKVHIFEPTPLVTESVHKLDYQWYKTATLESECAVHCLSWSTEGSRLLTGGETIQLWHLSPPSEAAEEEEVGERKVQFLLGQEDDDPAHQHFSHTFHMQQSIHGPPLSTAQWECIWKHRPASPIFHLQFSSDGLLFASAGKMDPLVKIWYEDKKVTPQLVRSDSLCPRRDTVHFSFVYISHPRAVTGFSWRQTSKYMPKGAVANMLVTSCLDNVCRIWVETILPDDGIVDLEQFDPTLSHDPKFNTHRHKKRFLSRLKTIRHAIQKRKRQPRYGPETVMTMTHVPSAGSVHDFHKFALHHNGVSPVLHFHLAGSINPETDIPLLPTIGGKADLEHNFVIHWLNNKELQFTAEAERVMADLHKRLSCEDSSNLQDDGHDDENNNSDDDDPHGLEQDRGMDILDSDSGHQKKRRADFFKRKHKSKSSKEGKHLGSHADSRDSIGSGQDSEDVTSSPEISSVVMEVLDRKIEALLKDWHQCPDMLFSIHPVDGSFLVWLVDWLDEWMPFTYRQAQVSFSSRLPHAFPLFDARTMASHLLLYCNYSKLDIRSVMRLSEKQNCRDGDSGGGPSSASAQASGKGPAGHTDNMLIPSILLVTKHGNGSLNQWQISFADNSKFQTILSVVHASRACGHRFRTNNVVCHPVLPLMLTSSHHNIPEDSSPDADDEDGPTENPGGFTFCSELILWRVDPVGPLSKSGGIRELARINAPPISAFSSLAWVPSLLPSSSLGTLSNSPSALFVASDGASLRLYQAVVDARTLLEGPQQKTMGMSFSSSGTSQVNGHATATRSPSDVFNIISLQSSARPGCVIELDAISDACQDWQNIQLLHVFQEQLVMEKTSTAEISLANTEACVDLRHLSSFHENFYLIVLEREPDGSRLHMWRITISSQPGGDGLLSHGKPSGMDMAWEDNGPIPASNDEDVAGRGTTCSTMSVTTAKVCSQLLPLPDGVHVINATVSAGHLNSATIYPACFAPYLLVTACTDEEVRFWRCDVRDSSEPHFTLDGHRSLEASLSSVSMTSYEFAADSPTDRQRRPSVRLLTRSELQPLTYNWVEWEMKLSPRSTSAIAVPGKPITVSCAYSGRVAIAYRLGAITTLPTHPMDKLVDLYVAIYECESTGGSEWVLEDTIELKNIKIPDPKAEIDLEAIFHENVSSEGGISPSSSFATLPRTKSVPSLSTIQSVRKSIAERGNQLGVLQQKMLVQLDWVSAEDGSHILTVGVGTKVLAYAQVSNEIAQASQKNFQAQQAKGLAAKSDAVKGPRPRPLLQKSKSLLPEDYQEEIRWMRLRAVELTTGDGLPPLPMHMSWVRAGILVVGMDNEMHVYSQWRGSSVDTSITPAEDITIDKRTLTEVNLAGMSGNSTVTKSFKSTASFLPSYSMPSFKHMSTTNLRKKEMWHRSDQSSIASKSSLTHSDSVTSLYVMTDFGLFEAARQANPVLVQYHPKLLMELLNFGKIRRVRAILAHLVRCITGCEGGGAVFVDEMDGEDLHSPSRLYRQRSINPEIDAAGGVPEDLGLDSASATSIPPLPIYALLAADNDMTVMHAEISKTTSSVPAGAVQPDYSDLFSGPSMVEEDLDSQLLSSSPSDGPKRTRMLSGSGQATMDPSYFGPAQAKVLTNYLLNSSLPNLSGLDQMYLMALADTVASTKMDFTEQFHSEENKPETDVHPNDSHPNLRGAAESMDECGLRFLLAMRHHIYLMGTLPPAQRAGMNLHGLRSFNVVWAFHSEATEELLAFIPSMQKGEPTWEDLRQFGAGWWIRNTTVLRKTIEKVAKVAFQKSKDPLDSAIYYMALKKKNVLWGLYRSVDNKRMADFFKNDFTQDRWRKAAMKNAFALLGRQQFMEAAAFFLLAGSVKDALEVCLEKLHDFQLAMVVCRLQEADDQALPESIQRLLYENVLGLDENGANYNRHHAHPDPFLRSMSYWLLKDYKAALTTLLHVNVGKRSLQNAQPDLDVSTITPNVFNFYNFLRTHPLLMRQRLAAASLGRRKSVVTGFTRANSLAVSENKITVMDKVTPMERRLFFQTAHCHFKNGCPLLALEVLSKLPPLVEDKEDEQISQGGPSKITDSFVNTGRLDTVGEDKEPEPEAKAESMDWSQPLTNGGLGDSSGDMDWGAPVTHKVRFQDELELDLKMSSSEDEEEEKEEDTGSSSKIPIVIVSDDSDKSDDGEDDVDRGKGQSQKLDIMAQQYKFIACIKVLMEEMRTMATGFEVDGGQLRYQLYVWLEKEAEVVKVLCNYGHHTEETTEAPGLDTSQEGDDMLEGHPRLTRQVSSRSDLGRGHLHEVLLAERMDLEAKMERLARRKTWLRTNHHLLRTLLSYCVLQGSGGGGLASIRMELLLLIQEYLQEKNQQQLQSPLPLPTTLPLLSASIASSKTVVADPIQHLQGMTQDLLRTIVGLSSPPGLQSNLALVLTMRNLAIALSACIYQTLCDSHNFILSQNEPTDGGLDGNSGQASALMGAVRRKRTKSISEETINTHPSKWPGVTSLQVLLAREKDSDAPKLNILLTEALFAVYVSLLADGLATYDPQMLYRLVANALDQHTWCALFGGGVRTLVRLLHSGLPASQPMDETSKQRVKLTIRALGTHNNPLLDDTKESFEERFISPELSMVTYFMTKPFVSPSEIPLSYDSELSSDSESEPEEEENEEDEDNMAIRPKSLKLPDTQEHSDPNSYTWCLLRYAIIHLVLHNLQTFLSQIGIELPELPNSSPLLHAVMKTLEQWDEYLLSRLELFSGPPDNYIQGLAVEVLDGTPQSKYRALLRPENSPFRGSSRSVMLIKRLWFQLVKQSYLTEIFIRYIYRKRKILPNEDSVDSVRTSSTCDEQQHSHPMKIIHKEQDLITAFAINQSNVNNLVLATQKELVELDIGQLLNEPVWLEDENEYDIECIKNPNPTDTPDFLLVQTPYDMPQNLSGTQTPSTPGSATYSMTGRGTTVGKSLNVPGIHNPNFSQIVVDRSRRLLRTLLRRNLPGVRRIGSHPLLPHYLSGSADGSVRLWEWGHPNPLTVLRQPGTFPKVTRVLFNAQGNKCCVSDIEGKVCLWQVGLGSNFNKAIMSINAHSKTTSDFCFVNSSSLIATAGHSNDNLNVRVHDLLLHPRQCTIHTFTCHEHGSPAIVYAPQHQQLISGGRKGDICIFDLRQMTLRQTFQAHDSPIKTLALDPEEEYFVTGSAEGDIKVWGLDVYQLLYSFPGEHSKATFFRNVGSSSGVGQVALGPGHRLYSCGVDGSLKSRQLPERETVVHHWMPGV